MGRLIDLIRRWLGGNDPVPPPVPPVPPVPVPTDIEQIKERLLVLHNQHRAARGVSALKRVVELDRSAQLHNDYMARVGNLTHNEPGRDIGKRVKEQGYQWRTVGENIAWNQQTADEVMKSWMNSSGHRANILSSSYQDVGFGVTQKGLEWWWTANFASR
jgi:uncharacterized protein YkwD